MSEFLLTRNTELREQMQKVRSENDQLRARVVELEAAIGRKDQAANVMANLTDKVQDRNEVLERERDAAIQRAEEYKQSWLQVEEAFNGCLAHDAVRDEQCRVANQRADSNYAAFEQEQKNLEECRQRAERAEADLAIYKYGNLELTKKLYASCEHRRKMLDELPAERAQEIADRHMHAENCDVMRMRSTVPHPCNCWSDGDARTLNSYAQAARDAQADLNDEL